MNKQQLRSHIADRKHQCCICRQTFIRLQKTYGFPSGRRFPYPASLVLAESVQREVVVSRRVWSKTLDSGEASPEGRGQETGRETNAKEISFGGVDRVS